jgi:hypothetical protein
MCTKCEAIQSFGCATILCVNKLSIVGNTGNEFHYYCHKSLVDVNNILNKCLSTPINKYSKRLCEAN